MIEQSACSPYEEKESDFYAGLVDPKGFPAAYIGVPGYRRDRPLAIAPRQGYVANKRVDYYAFDYPQKTGMGDDPSFVPWSEIATVYVYEPPGERLPDSQRCNPPQEYAFDLTRDSYSKEEQGAVFTRLPSEPTYRPIVAEIPVSASGQICQSEKSERLILDNHTQLLRSGRLRMWPVLDPGTDVLLPDELDEKKTPTLPLESARTPQYWGWYRQRLLAYLDGGFMPYAVDANSEGVRLQAQWLLFPLEVQKEVDGKPQPMPGHVGDGYDVLQYQPGDPNYSPLCRVAVFQSANSSAIETSAEDILGKLPATDLGVYTYCVQLPSKP